MEREREKVKGDTYIPFDVQSIEHLLVGLLEVVSQFELGLLRAHVTLHFRVSVIDDGQEHVQENEEDEEDIGQEEDRPENAVGIENG